MSFTPTPYPMNTTGKALRGHALETHRAQLYAWEAEALLAAFLADHPEIPESSRDALMEHVSTKAREWGQTDGQRQEVITHLAREVTRIRRTVNAMVDVYGAAHSMRRRFRKPNQSTELFDKAQEKAIEIARLNACEPE